MKNQIIDALSEIGAIKFGEFKLKSGIISPIYLDLRIIVSYPKILNLIAKAFIEISKDLDYDLVAGIPYTALPIATAFSLLSDKGMVYCRKERKKYGTAQQIEGVWNSGDSVLVIDDLITNGDSKLETVALFQNDGLVAKDIIVLIDREQGGKEKLKSAGLNLISYISIYEILDRLKSLNQISEIKYTEIKEFIQNNGAN